MTRTNPSSLLNRRDPVLGDLNADGRLDIVTAGGLLLQEPARTFLTAPFDCRTNAPALVRCLGQEPTVDVLTADMDGDADLDVVGINQGGPGIVVHLNSGAGRSEERIPLNDTADFGTPRMVSADFTGDGQDDLLIVDNRPNLSEPGLGRLIVGDRSRPIITTAGSFFDTVPEPMEALAGDLDGDGRLDAVVVDVWGRVGVHLNRSARSFSSATSPLDLRPGWNVRGFALGDFDGDEDLDLAVAGGSGQSLIYSNRGGETPFFLDALPFDEQSKAIDCQKLGLATSGAVRCLGGLGDQITDLAAADMDGDGDTDLVAVRLNAPGAIFRNNGEAGIDTAASCSGTNAARRCFGDARAADYLLVAVGDMDRDGRTDIVTAAQPGPARIFLADAAGRFALARSAGERVTCESRPQTVRCFGGAVETVSQLLVADLDQDTDLDIITGNNESFVASYLNDGDGNVPATRLVKTGGRVWGLAVGGFDADEGLELIVGDGSNWYVPGRPPGSRGLVDGATNLRLGAPPCVSARGACFTQGGPLTLTLTIADLEGDQAHASNLRGRYSLDGGGTWQPAALTLTGQDGQVRTGTLATSATGIDYDLAWDTSRFFGQSDQTILRVELSPAQQRVASPLQRAAAVAQTAPFRARGSPIRVVVREGVLPPQTTGGAVGREYTLHLPFVALLMRTPFLQPGLGGARVFLVPSEGGIGAPLRGSDQRPLETNRAGFLLGRGTDELSGTLIAIQPVYRAPGEEGEPDRYTVYFTNAAPQDTGFEGGEPVEALRPLTLETGPEHPLVLFNFVVSLEWDIDSDDEYLRRLETDLKAASARLYDWTNGQAALGEVRVFDQRQRWNQADLRIYASNEVRPNSAISGLLRGSGQIRMGPVWNRFGDDSVGLTDDWARALAHEIGHYAFGLNDNYLSENAAGLLEQTDSCAGVMTNPYLETDNNSATYTRSEFRSREDWQPDCDKTISQVTLGRADWELITGAFPWLQRPGKPFRAAAGETGILDGPNQLLLELTTVDTSGVGEDEGQTRPGPLFSVDTNDFGEGATAYLLKGAASSGIPDDIIELGRPVQGQIRVRGATKADRLCVFDLNRTGVDSSGGRERFEPQSGCLGLDQVSSRILLDSAWRPELEVTPEPKSEAVRVRLTPGIAVACSGLQARLYTSAASGAGEGRPTATFAPATDGSAACKASLPVAGELEGRLFIWQQATEGPPTLQTIVSYGLGDTPSRASPSIGTANAPVLSPDGQVIIYGRELDRTTAGLFAFQGAARVPDPPAWATIVGRAYLLTAAPGAPSLSRTSINLNYLGRQVPPGEEEGVRVYYYDPLSTCKPEADPSACWQILPSSANTTLNVVTAPMRGPGIYAVMSAVQIVLPNNGWNNFGYSSRLERPVEEALRSIAGKYTLVYELDPTRSRDAWPFYNPANPEGSTLKTLRPGRGYQIFMREPGQVLLIRGGARAR